MAWSWPHRAALESMDASVALPRLSRRAARSRRRRRSPSRGPRVSASPVAVARVGPRAPPGPRICSISTDGLDGVGRRGRRAPGRREPFERQGDQRAAERGRGGEGGGTACRGAARRRCRRKSFSRSQIGKPSAMNVRPHRLAARPAAARFRGPARARRATRLGPSLDRAARRARPSIWAATRRPLPVLRLQPDDVARLPRARRADDRPRLPAGRRRCCRSTRSVTPTRR